MLVSDGALRPRRRRWKTIVAILLLNISVAHLDERSGFFSLVREGHRLDGHVIYEKDVKSELDCTVLCFTHTRRCPPCKSINLQKKQDTANKMRCQLNDETDENAKRGGLVPDASFDHWKLEGLEYSNVQDQCQSKDGRFCTCSDIKQKFPERQNGSYCINPLGDGPFLVHCDMSSKGGIGVTEIAHDSENRTEVNGYEEPGAYSRKIVYNASMDNIAALTEISQHCEQFLKYECFHSTLELNETVVYGWWVSRQGTKMIYWGGATGHDGKCACAMTNSCAGGWKCNCDENDEELRKDEGYLTDKGVLPVTELRFGDTGRSFEYGFYTLGKLLCWE